MGLLGQGVRLAWDDLPPAVHAGVGSLLGSPVVSVRPCVGGFSPGAACAVTLAYGGRAFVKAVSPAQNPHTPDMYRQEAANHAWLPAHPAVPALLGTYDDGEWVALAFELVDAGTPALPWVASELSTALRAVGAVRTAAGALGGGVRQVEEQYAEDFTAWRTFAGGAPLDGLDAWSLAHLDRLAELEAGWAAYAAGSALLHTDLRADNLLVRGDDAWVVDWAWLCAGAEWVDTVLIAPSVALQGGPPPEALLASASPSAPAEGVLAVAVALAGFFTARALEPPLPGLPTVRAHQARSGAACREWLGRLLAC
jgi:aminoglycoside phosphotransferase (APT) family kinase protein